MKILWITARRMDTDLAASTEIGISKSLKDNGNILQFISPSKKILNNLPNIQIKYLKLKGLETLSGGIYLNKKIFNKSINLHDYDLIFIDWRYVYSIRKELIKNNLKWVIIDRGPPAYSGIMAKLQTLLWKKSWKIANKKSIGGLVVSDNHKKYVKDNIPINMKLYAVNAGTNTKKYDYKNKIGYEKIRFVYIGRIEKRRGLDCIHKLVKNLDHKKIDYTIELYGQGRYLNNIKNNNYPKVVINEPVSRNELPSILNKFHVGLMPMPDIDIWRIASPLKLVEYLAAGLIIMGPKHSGNMVNGIGEWPLLGSNEDWINEGIDKILKISEDNEWGKLAKNANELSKDFDWEVITKNMLGEILIWME